MNKMELQKYKTWSDRTHNGTKALQDIFPDVQSYTEQYYLLFSTARTIYHYADKGRVGRHKKVAMTCVYLGIKQSDISVIW